MSLQATLPGTNNHRVSLLRYGNFIMLLLIFASCKQPERQEETVDWNTYRGDDGVNAYSPLDQVNKSNVHQLRVAWTYRTGDTIGNSSIQCNPLVIDGVLYGMSPRQKVFALDAATGKEKWKFDPFPAGSRESGVSRGLTWWSTGSIQRVFFSASHKLFSLDAKTGRPDLTFGDSGYVDMREGLRDDGNKENYFIRNTSPGVVFRDMIIIGSSLGETYDGLPGHIRAFDVRTGKLRWTFNTIPQPGERGYDTWPSGAYKYASGCNAWSGLSIDKARGLVFAATGAPSFDFHGGDRAGDNLFGNSVIALNASTGKYVWHFQVSHHDLWDYDLPSPPNLVTLKIDGEKKDAVVQVTKQGFIFVLDRETGKPLFPVEERNVAQSWMDDEQASPTQPFPLRPLPLVRQGFDTNVITNISPASYNYVKKIVDEHDFGNIYTPPNTKGIVQLPGFRGGAEWSGGAIDKLTGIMYIGVNDIANLVQLVEVPGNAPALADMPLTRAGQILFQQHCSPCHGADRRGTGPYPSLIGIDKRLSREEVKTIISQGRSKMPAFPQLSEAQKDALAAFLLQIKTNENFSGALQTSAGDPGAAKRYRIKGYMQLKDQDGYPGTRPPWGILKAVDLNRADILWSKPLGEYPALARQGIRHTGTQLFGGGVVSRGGLLFIGASQDEKFRAIDIADGKTLWEYQLPAGGYATPAMYAVNGKQYIVIAAGGGGFQVTKPGDAYVAFTLGESKKVKVKR